MKSRSRERAQPRHRFLHAPPFPTTRRAPLFPGAFAALLPEADRARAEPPRETDAVTNLTVGRARVLRSSTPPQGRARTTEASAHLPLEVSQTCFSLEQAHVHSAIT